MQRLIKLPKRQRIFESLEPRNLLAGNVTADSSSGALIVLGDNSANIITITQVSPDTYKVAGTATKVNGSNSAQTFYATDGIFINMNGGNDVLTVKNLTINGETGDIGLGIMLGAGADVLLVQKVTVGWETAIDGGEGNNAIVIDSCHLNYDLGIQTYGGVDAVVIKGTTILGALQVQLGNGTNALTMLNVNVFGSPGGPDMSTIPEGFEILECALPRIECGANIFGGSGVDAIALNGVKIDCLTHIDTDGGVDSVAIVNSRFGNQPMIYSGGLQSLQMDGAASGLCIETGLGNDAVAIVTTTVYGFLQIDTSGQVCCPTERLSITTLLEPSSVKDGIDAVSLVKVNVYAAQPIEWSDSAVAPEIETSDWSSSWLESGLLLIYTGNQTDAVALASVCTDGKATIRTTDWSDSNLDGADAVAIANSKFNQQSRCDWETGLCIVTGRGNDAVSIVKVNVAGKAKIETGDGTDAVALAFLAADRICVRMGDGNYDVLTVSNCTATDAVFDGGGNTGDLLNWKHLNNHFGSESDSGFQYVL